MTGEKFFKRRVRMAMAILFPSFGLTMTGCQSRVFEAEMEALAAQHGLAENLLFDRHFRQGWRPELEGEFEPARARLYLKNDDLYVIAVLGDAVIKNESVQFNERTWEKGDVFEIFIQTHPKAYYEFHVTPENTNSFLRLIPENADLATLKRELTFIDDPTFVETATRVFRNERMWSVIARIPQASLGMDRGKMDTSFRIAFARCDSTPGRGEPILSATPNFPQPNFHDRTAWHSLPWPW